MIKQTNKHQKILNEVKELRIKLDEAERTLNAIRSGKTDTLVVSSSLGERVFMLKGEDYAYRVLVEAMNEGAATLAADGTILYCNSNLASLVKTPLEKLTGTPFRSLITPASLALFETIFRKSLDSSGKGELILMAGDGTNVPVYFSASTMKSNDISMVCAVVTDLTKQKSDEAILASVKLTSAVLEQAGEVILVCDETGHIIRNSRMAQQLLGITPTGKHFDEVLPLRKDSDGQVFSISETLRGDIQKHLEVTLDRKDGNNPIFLLSSIPLRSAEGGVVGVVSTMLDITERKKTDQILKESEKRYRALFESAAEGIIITDAETKKHKYANPAMCKLLGYSQEELTKLGVSDIHPKASLEEVIAVFNSHARGEKTFASLPCLKKDGTIIYTDINAASAIIDGKVCNIGFFSDVTERRNMQGQLMAQDRLASIGQLVAGVAHEINNPLTAVIGFSELLMKRTDIPQAAKEDLKIVDDEARRTAKIVQNLLTFARKQPEGKALLGINENIQTVLTLRGHEQKVNSIRVITHFASDLPQVMGNSSQLQQVLFNVVINAEFFMLKAHGKGTLTITTERIRDVVRASIADDGPGISEDNMKQLFTPFFTTKEVGKGTGLGLAISYGIVTEHGGRMWAVSEFAKGATFIVELPICKAAAKEQADVKS